MKYIPGLHLRISDEAEESGLDLDQFFEEEIGDWGMLHELQRKQAGSMIVGHSPCNAASSSEAVEMKPSATAEVLDGKPS
jgi:Amt family ammonium transporter